MLRMAAEIRPASASLNRLGKQFRYAQAVALTRTAQFAHMDLRRDLSKVFDRPTPYTASSTYMQRATPVKLVAEVGFRGDPKRHYLTPQVHGGDRAVRGFEYHLRRAGLLYADEFVVPANGYPRDVYGNVPRKVYAAILADVRAHPDQLSWSTRDSRSKRGRRRNIGKRAVYFASRGPGMWYGRKQHLPRGIYERTRMAWGSSIRGVFMFVRKPSYKPRLPLLEIVVDNINLHLADETDKALRMALATARSA